MISRSKLYYPQVVFNDALFEFSKGKAGSSSPTWKAMAGSNMFAWHFETGKDQDLHGIMQLSHGVKAGTLLYPHLQFRTIDANAGNMKWNIEFTYANEEEVFIADATDTITVAAGGVARKHRIENFTTITPASDIKGSAIIQVMIQREGTHVDDNYGSDVIGLAADWHVALDKTGTSSIVHDDVTPN